MILGIGNIIQLLFMNRLNKPESAIFITCRCFRAFKGSPFLEYIVLIRIIDWRLPIRPFCRNNKDGIYIYIYIYIYIVVLWCMTAWCRFSQKKNHTRSCQVLARFFFFFFFFSRNVSNFRKSERLWKSLPFCICLFLFESYLLLFHLFWNHVSEQVK